MTSPGGREVGRVSVRVVPDTSGFRRKLQAELAGIDDVKIDITPNTNGLRQKVQAAAAAAGRGVNAKIGVDVDRSALDRVRNTTQRALSGMNMPDFLNESSVLDRVTRNVMQNAQRIRESLTRAASGFRDITRGADGARNRLSGLQRIARGFGSAFSAVRSGIDAVGQGLITMAANGSNIFTRFIAMGGRVGGAFGAIAAAATSIVGVLLLASVAASALAIAGAAITAVWGAAATAVAAVPAALFLVAGPLAAIIVGVEGIKRAFASLTPEMNRMKSAVESTFERGLKPAVENIRTIMPTLQEGLVGVADRLSVMGVKVSELFQRFDQMGTISTIFSNIRGALDGSTLGILRMIDSIAILGSQQPIFDALVRGVDEFGRAWREGVIAVISDGSLSAAAAGLGETFAALSRAIQGLIVNGIRAFASAAPGFNAALDSITNFFGRFDWDRLGASVSNVFEGLSKAIDSIPDGVIEQITQAFEDMGTAINSPAFSTGFGLITQGIADLLSSFDEMIGFGGQLVSFFSGIGELLNGVDSALRASALAVRSFFTGSAEESAEAARLWAQSADQFGRGTDLIGQAFTDAGPKIAAGGASAAAAAQAAGQQIVQGATTGIDQGIPGLLGRVQNLSSALQPNAVTTAIPPQWRGLGQSIGDNLASGVGQALPLVKNQAEILSMSTLPPATTNGAVAQWTAVGHATGEAARSGMEIGEPLVKNQAQILGQATAPPAGTDLKMPWEQGVKPIPETAAQGLAPVGNAADEPLATLGEKVTTATGTWEQNLATGMTGMSEAVRAGFVGMGTEFDTAMQGGTTRITAMTQQWAQAFTTSFTGMNDAVRNGFVTMGTEFDTAAQGGSTRIQGMVTQWASAFTAGFATMNTAVRSGFVTMGAEFDVAAQGGATRISAMTTTWGTTFSQGFAQINNAVRTGFTFMGSEFDLASQGGVTRITAMTTAWGAAFTAGFASTMNTAVRAGFVTMGAEFDVASQGGITRITAMTQAWGQAFTAGFSTNLNNAVRQGFVAMGVEFQAAQEGGTARITAMTAAWAAAMTAGMQQMTTGVQAGFANLINTVAMSMAMIGVTIQVGASLWGVSMAVGIAGMAAAVAAGFAGIAAVVAAQMAMISAVILAGTVGWAAAVAAGSAMMTASATAAFMGMAAVAAAGMAMTTAVVVAGMAACTAAVVAGAAMMTAAFVACFAAISAAAAAGMARFTAVVRAGVAAGVAACNAAVGQFRAAGVNMGAALAQGLESQVGRVQAAAARLANAAAAATAAAAQIRSPSRVFLRLGGYVGEGFANGIDQSRKDVAQAGKRMVAVAVATAAGLQNAFGSTDLAGTVSSDVSGDISRLRSMASSELSASIESGDYGNVIDRIAEELARWNIVIDRDGIARMVNNSNVRRARR